MFAWETVWQEPSIGLSILMSMCAAIGTMSLLWFLLGSPLHEFFHNVAGKLLGGYSHGTKWLEGITYVCIPPQREYLRWLVDCAGGCGSGIVYILLGVGSVTFFATVSRDTLVFPTLLGAAIAFIGYGVISFYNGTEEIWRNKEKRELVKRFLKATNPVQQAVIALVLKNRYSFDIWKEIEALAETNREG